MLRGKHGLSIGEYGDEEGTWTKDQEVADGGKSCKIRSFIFCCTKYYSDNQIMKK
jgi:hypothetical protein